MGPLENVLFLPSNWNIVTKCLASSMGVCSQKSLYWIDLFCCHSSSYSCGGCGGPERSHQLCHRLCCDHCILRIYGHSTGIVLSFVQMRCGTGHGTRRVQPSVLFWHGTMYFSQICGHGMGMVLVFVLFQS